MSIQKICAGFETTLAAKLLAGGTSFSLSSHLTKKGVELSGEYGFILGEGTAVEEWCYGTVVSGVVTIIKRGLDPEDPTTEVLALKFDHDRGSSVKITDYPFLGFLREYIAGNVPLPSPLKYETHQTPTEDEELIDKKYADDLFSGAIGTASNSTAGGIKTDKANNGKPRTYQTLVQEQATPDMTLKVLPFKVAVNEKIVDYAGGNTAAFVAPVANPRIDLLVYDTAGSALAVRAGSEAASPSAPTPTSGDIILAEIYHRVGETSVKEIDDTTNGYISKWFIPNVYRTDLLLATDGLTSDMIAKKLVYLPAAYNLLANKAVIIGNNLPTANGSIVSGTNDNTNYSGPGAPFKVSTSFLMPTGVFNLNIISGSYKFIMYSGSGAVTFHLYNADSNGAPIGVSLANSGSQAIGTSGGTNFTLAYSGLIPGNKYAIVADITVISGTMRFYNVTHDSNPNCASFDWNGTAWVSRAKNPVTFNYTATLTKNGYVDYSKATSNDTFANNFIGITLEAKNANENIKVQHTGIVGGFSGLTIGATYYLSNTSGEISTSAGSQSRKIGIAISATELLLKPDNV